MRNSGYPLPLSVISGLSSDHASPLFVTWNTRSSRSGRPSRLRGCIGNFEPMPIREGLAEYALISAFRDSRFRGIDKSELETLECGYVLHFHVFLPSSFESIFEI